MLARSRAVNSSGVKSTPVAPVLAREEPAAQGTPTGQSDPFGEEQGHELVLDGALDQAVLVLSGHETRPALGVAGQDRLRDAPGLQVCEADVADLARGHEVIERLERLLHRREGVQPPMV